MNVAQIIKSARLKSDAIRVDRTISPLWTDEELVDLANEVTDHMAPHLRMTHRHYHQTRMLSTDASLTILGQTFDPTTMHLISGTQFVTLPPDCVEVLRLTPIVNSSSPENSIVRFIPRDIADPAYIEADIEGQQLQVNGAGLGRFGYFYDIVGQRTLRFAPIITTTIDVELLYVARKQAMALHSTGTVNVTTTAVTGLAQSGQDFTLVPLPCEFIVGTTEAPDPDPSRIYPAVSSIASATSLTLSSSGGTAAYAKYMLASVPVVPEQHHRWMASMVADLMLRKVSAQLASERLNLTLAKWQGTVLPDLTHPRQSQEPVMTVPFLPDGG